MELPDVASGLKIPPALQSSIDRHRSHVTQLAATLHAAGMPEAQIEASVTTLITSYRAELILALKSMMKDDADGRYTDR